VHSRPRTERSSAKCSRALCVGLLQGAEVLSCGEMTEGGATEPCFDFGGPALHEDVTLNGLSIPVTASSLSEPK